MLQKGFHYWDKHNDQRRDGKCGQKIGQSNFLQVEQFKPYADDDKSSGGGHFDNHGLGEDFVKHSCEQSDAALVEED